jgi:RNA polymerase sigma-70 factor
LNLRESVNHFPAKRSKPAECATLKVSSPEPADRLLRQVLRNFPNVRASDSYFINFPHHKIHSLSITLPNLPFNDEIEFFNTTKRETSKKFANSAKLIPFVNPAAEKQIEESITRLISRAENSRGLKAADLRERIEKSVEKYLLRDGENASSAEIKAFVDDLRADDLCLIVACENGIESAWDDLVKNFDQTVKSAARKIAHNNDDAEDLASSIWAELYGLKHDKDGKLRTKLAYYSGRGSLAGWLRAVVSQLAIDEFRKQSKFVQIEENREFENLANESSEKSENNRVVAHSDNPEQIFSEKQTQKDVADALKSAIDELGTEDRLILKLYYFDDLKLKDIGATLGFHEATASRKLVRVQTEIRKSVERILKTSYGWSDSETKRYLAETAEKLGINLEKMVAILLVAAVVQDIFASGVLK